MCDPDAKFAHLSPPSDLLARWVDRIPPGPALDLGAGRGTIARWLAARGFQVDAVERDPALFRELRAAYLGGNPKAHYSDIMNFSMEAQWYALVVAQAVLHYLTPQQCRGLATRILTALAPGAWLVAEVLTTDDPECAALRAGGAERLGAHTFRIPATDRVLHFFEAGELKSLFSSLQIMEYEVSRRIAPGTEAGYRAGASLVACNPGPQDEARQSPI